MSPAHARPPAEPETRAVAEWEPNEVVRPSDYQHDVVRPSKHQRTPDAAVVWHGSPTPEDTGRWAPPAPRDGRGNPPRLAIAGGPSAAAPATAVDPGAAYGLEPATTESAYHQPSLARETAALAGANGATGRPLAVTSAGGRPVKRA